MGSMDTPTVLGRAASGPGARGVVARCGLAARSRPVLSFALAVFLVLASGVACARSAEPVTYAPLPETSVSAWPGPTEVVVPVAVVTAAPLERVSGIASWMPARYGRDYLALPGGAGLRVRICGAGGCWIATSTDAGPDRAMQRAGRVADVAVGRWEQVCGLPRSAGLCPVSVEFVR